MVTLGEVGWGRGGGGVGPVPAHDSGHLRYRLQPAEPSGAEANKIYSMYKHPYINLKAQLDSNRLNIFRLFITYI